MFTSTIVIAVQAATDTTFQVIPIGEARSTFSTLDTQDAAFSYQVTNTSKSTQIISRIEASCGCLAAGLASEGRTAAALTLPVTLAPGQTVLVRATVRLSELRPGTFHKTITLWGLPQNAPQPKKINDATALSQAQELAQIQISGTLAPPVLFAREQSSNVATELIPLTSGPIDFKRIAATDLNNANDKTGSQNTPHEFTLVATPDPRLVAQAKADGIPILISSHPAVRVIPLSDEFSSSASDFSSKSLKTLRYRISLAPDAPLGPFLATLAFRINSKPDSSEEQLRQEQAWRTASVLVSGEIIGDLSASPSLVTFVLRQPTGDKNISLPSQSGNSAVDMNLTRQVVLTAIRPEALTGLTVQTDNSLVQAKLSHSPNSDVRTLLTISLSPDIYKASFPSFPANSSSAGSAFSETGTAGASLQSRVTITLANGQQIVVPVTIYRIPSLPPTKTQTE